MSPMPSQTLRLLSAIGGVVVAVGLFALTLMLSDNGAIEFTAGDDVFDVGRPEVLAQAIAADGPILFPDLAGGRLPIYLQHLGDDLGGGWTALSAVSIGVDGPCPDAIAWDPTLFDGEGGFHDPCDDVIAADGGGVLVTYPVTVTPDAVRVDLKAGDGTD